MAFVRHVVLVNLQFDESDPRTKEFFDETKKVYGTGAIPEVYEYHHYDQIIGETDYRYGFVLDFLSEEDFDICIKHPLALEYNRKYWNSAFLKDCLETNLIEFD